MVDPDVTGRSASTGRLLDAILPVAGDLSLPILLRRIVQSASELADAQYAALGVLDEEGQQVAEFITVGMDDQTVSAIGDPPSGKGILGLLIVQPQPIRLADLTQHPDSFGIPANHPPMTTFLGVPVRVRDQVFGNLYLTDKLGGREFTAEDEELVTGLAAVAGVAIENARLHARVRDLALLEDRDRIARELHDTVIQRLYATGMSLTGTIRLTERGEVAERIQQAVDDLDDTIRDIRSSIFALHSVDRGKKGLRADVLRLAGRAENSLGFVPSVAFDGLVDSGVPEGIADHLLAALRESLTNVAKHANARRVWVRLAVTEDVELTVSDDGQGLSEEHSTGSGLRNLTERAAVLGGAFVIRARAAGGTEVVWRVPRSST